MKGAWAVLAAVGLVCVAWAASRQNHRQRGCWPGAFCGLGALGAVNLLGSYTGVTLALNYAAAYASVVLGAPGGDPRAAGAAGGAGACIKENGLAQEGRPVLCVKIIGKFCLSSCKTAELVGVWLVT